MAPSPSTGKAAISSAGGRTARGEPVITRAWQRALFLSTHYCRALREGSNTLPWLQRDTWKRAARGHSVTGKDNGRHFKCLSRAPCSANRKHRNPLGNSLYEEGKPGPAPPAPPWVLRALPPLGSRVRSEVPSAPGRRGGPNPGSQRLRGWDALTRRLFSAMALFMPTEATLRRGRTQLQSPQSAVLHFSLFPTGQALKALGPFGAQQRTWRRRDPH